MDIEQVRNLLKETQATVDLYLSTGNDDARIDAQEKAEQLARTLERPKDAVLKLAYSPTILTAVKAAHDMNLFEVLANATSPVTLSELVAAKPADPLLVERILRLVVANGFAKQTAPREYLPTSLSKEMTKQGPVATIESMFIEMLPALNKVPEYLQKTNYRNPDDPMATVIQHTYDVKTDGFTWLSQNPAAFARFNSFMGAQRAGRPHWGDWFPVEERILTHPALSSQTPLIVDIGAGRGHDLMGFKTRFPHATGRLILEDLSRVIEEVNGPELETFEIETVVHDFFAEAQPISGARVYYFKNVLHDWSDEQAAIIFKNLKPAMKRGFSKIIMEEYILPDTNARSLPCMTDLSVMMFCAGLERTRQRWTELLESVGLQVVKFWMREGDELGVVEAALAEE
ncbi:Plant methyltransferase dimerization [Penicillium chermesinum]|uniref:Plant methyltransferase dimerization n=1 Tax=Penicillium chermesinum TaxID=63820 RepID=A0A9W9PI85_9EURO|nr:Plant methyltransferase dimerization [Penicillium chermesinum]KAJ5247306.1 Plant methyltransferase dimerization [Penicillium chermesinum]